MPYRVEPDALRRERVRLLARMRELEARWADAFWAEIAPERGIDPPRATGWQSDDLAGDVAALTRRLTALEAAESAAAELEASWRRAGETRAERMLAWARQSERLGRVAQEIAEAARRQDLDLDVRFWNHADAGGPSVGPFTFSTGVARGLGSLQVRRESLMDDLTRLIGANREIEIGDEEFDGVFRIDGDPATARAVLRPNARRALLRLGVGSAPRLGITRSMATLDGIALGEVEIDRAAIAASIEVLRAVRDAPLRPLRREAALP